MKGSPQESLFCEPRVWGPDRPSFWGGGTLPLVCQGFEETALESWDSPRWGVPAAARETQEGFLEEVISALG